MVKEKNIKTIGIIGWISNKYIELKLYNIINNKDAPDDLFITENLNITEFEKHFRK